MCSAQCCSLLAVCLPMSSDQHSMSETASAWQHWPWEAQYSFLQRHFWALCTWRYGEGFWKRDQCKEPIVKTQALPSPLMLLPSLSIGNIFRDETKESKWLKSEPPGHHWIACLHVIVPRSPTPPHPPTIPGLGHQAQGRLWSQLLKRVLKVWRLSVLTLGSVTWVW